MKMFECIIDDGKNVFKEVVAANSKKHMLDQWGGNGNFLIVKDVTKDCPIDTEKLQSDLLKLGWGMAESRLIMMLAEEHMKKQK